jgi:outer membrane protein OmpA-like peptidoglycan-associated protein
MKKSTISIACLATLLAGCSVLPSARTSNRVPANPANFSAGTAGYDEKQAIAAEREILTRTVADLRSEVQQLQQLFRLQNAPLSTGEINSDVFEPPAKVGSARPLVPANPRPPAAAGAAQLAGLSAQAPALPALQPMPPATVQQAPAPATIPAAAKPAPAAVSAASAQKQAVTPATYMALFKFASSALDDTSKAALAALRPQLLQAAKVALNAYADTSGDTAVNAKLAQARASSIEQELVRMGVPKDRIQVNAKVADSQPPSGSTLLGLFRAPYSLGRRVDVALLSNVIAQ